MNAHTLAKNAYSPTMTAIKTPRAIEYEAFARITSRMQSAASGSARRPKAIAQTIQENRQLWSLLSYDIIDENNLLPQSLKSQLLYLAEFTRVHSSKVLRGEAKMDVLIEINTAVMKGLRGNARLPA